MVESSDSQSENQKKRTVKELKFIKTLPQLISLKSSTLNDEHAPSQGWHTHRVSKHIDTHEMHLVLREGSGYPPRTLHVIECLPLHASQVFSSFRIALHDRGVISMIAFCKPGVVDRILSQMRATDDAELSTLTFAPSVGHDERARISYYGNNKIAIESFMAHLNALCPFNSEVMLACRLVLDGLSTQSWEINHIPKVEALVDDLRGYPNFLPDVVDFDHSYLYETSDIINFPDKIPELHDLVLKGNIDDVGAYLSKNSDAVLYQRDPFGHLAIELALNVNIDIARLLFYHWYDHMGAKPKPLWKQYMRCANKIMRAEQNMPSKNSALTPDSAISERMPKRLGLHQAVLSHTPVSVDYFINKLQAFNDFYQRMLSIHKDACIMSMRYIDHIPEHDKHATFKRLASYEETWARELTFIAAKVAVHPVCIKQIKDRLLDVQGMWRKNGHSDAEIENFNKHTEAIFKYKEQAINRIEKEKLSYREHCMHASDVEFNLYTSVLALLAGKEIYSALIPLESNEEVSISGMLLLVFEHYSKQLDPVEKRYHDYLKSAYTHSDEKLKRYARQHLTEAEYPDPFGYTPLLLAIVANNTQYVKAFFDAGCYLDTVDNYVDFGVYYTLLEHANTPEMLELLLYYFQNPNQPITLMNRLRWEGQEVLLRYGHKLQPDSSRLSEIDKIIKGISRYEKPAEMLSVLLKYSDEELVDGPYDACVATDVQDVIKAHNERIRGYREHMARCPKISSVKFENNEVITSFSSVFESRLKHVSSLDDKSKQELAEIFAKNFKMREQHDDLAARMTFFKSYLEQHPQFLIDVYYDASKKIVGFATFAIFKNTQLTHEQQSCHFMYLSMAACLPAANNGLPLSSFRAILAMHKLSSNDQMPLYFYARIGRPGIIIKLLAEGPWSVKYAVDNKLVRHLIETVVGDRLESDGVTSLPPVSSLATRRGGADRMIEEYEHWLNKNPNTHPEASVTVVSEVTDNMITEWRARIELQNGSTHESMETYIEGFESLITPSSTLVCKL